MQYVSCLRKTIEGDGYPFTVPAIQAMGDIRFTTPITILCGDNGSGKSTVLSILASKLRAVRIGQEVIERERVIKGVQDCFALHKLPCKHNFLFSAEDFIAYIAWTNRMKAEARAEIARIEADPTMPDKEYASMPHYHTLSDLTGMYANNLSTRSHGEGFLDFFQSRLRPGGLYLLDEPEGALSFEKQFALALLIEEAAAQSQFILATHSPILTAIPGARILQAGDDGFHEIAYNELESIQFLKLFMECPSRMFRR